MYLCRTSVRGDFVDRAILHCDMNNFFASVELLDMPNLRLFPVAVCGDAEMRHGIVLAKNDIAKAFGIKTGETIGSAKKKCPSLKIVSPHYDKYKEYSERAKKYTTVIPIFVRNTA